MGNKTFIRSAFIAILVMVSLFSVRAQVTFHDSKHLFVGPKPSSWDLVGPDVNLILGQQWGIEFYENGLNFWRPWPSLYWGNYKIFIGQDGKVGFGLKNTTTTHMVNISGSQIMVGSSVVSSDRALKRNITNLNDSRYGYLDKFYELSGKSYEKQISSADGNADEVSKMVAQGKIKPDDAVAALEELNARNKTVYKHEFGFIAQELRELFPELVQEETDGLLTINYMGVIPLLVEGIKDVKRKIAELENRVEVIK